MFTVKIKPMGKCCRVKTITNISSFEIEDGYIRLFQEDDEHGVLTHRLKIIYYTWIEVYDGYDLVVKLYG